MRSLTALALASTVAAASCVLWFMKPSMTRKRVPLRRCGVYAVATAAAATGVRVLYGVLRRAAVAHQRLATTIDLDSGCLISQENKVSLLCMNALAPNLVSRQRYSYVPEGVLSWRFRYKKLCALLKKVP